MKWLISLNLCFIVLGATAEWLLPLPPRSTPIPFEIFQLPFTPTYSSGIAPDWITIKWFGDIDKDGAIEFILESAFCSLSCTEVVQIYEYDQFHDSYYVAQEIIGRLPAIETYADLDLDGNPELISGSAGFCLMCGASNVYLTAVKVWRYEQGQLVDVSQQFPAIIEHDIARLNDFITNYGVNDVALASYMYNMYRLGKIEEARQTYQDLCPHFLGNDPTATCKILQMRVELVITTSLNQNQPNPD